MKLRIAGIVRESVVDGPGIRLVIFAQGCPHCCPGCHNPETHDPLGGQETTVEEIVEQVRQSRFIRGVTFSGGEPFYQAEAFSLLGRRIKELGKDIVTYTGYTFEEILALAEINPYFGELLQVSDWLVDGPFILAERDLNLPFRGSRNQRIIDVRRSLRQGKAVPAEIA
ncbi:anaerobic ribonucleoside-triphosphate reductase activating protein [Calderihabitans maritimus]|uniref:Anaerobic ribonucleoside-triphosphate reductase-activating protein n=1 Tax=Calderihabitans maritimus TaxID=1246530 RepID=A0A1Z5HRH4_9FIRM|nr:anaerobic ribonucleoside-triphosphate reductase activating protein [Calderihabitans maritimus]GAW92129.1 anaerobic ribonucleoside-triphosphate reductase activating protein NrdG [Calderihabitans maritimus]